MHLVSLRLYGFVRVKPKSSNVNLATYRENTTMEAVFACVVARTGCSPFPTVACRVRNHLWDPVFLFPNRLEI